MKITLLSPYHLSPKVTPPPYLLPTFSLSIHRDLVGRRGDFGTTEVRDCPLSATLVPFPLPLFLCPLTLIAFNEEQGLRKTFFLLPRQGYPRLYVRSNTHAFAQRLSVRQEERRTCGQLELQAVASAEIVGPRTAISRTPLSDDGHIGLPFQTGHQTLCRTGGERVHQHENFPCIT